MGGFQNPWFEEKNFTVLSSKRHSATLEQDLTQAF